MVFIVNVKIMLKNATIINSDCVALKMQRNITENGRAFHNVKEIVVKIKDLKLELENVYNIDLIAKRLMEIWL